MKPLRVLLADDDPLLRESMANLLDAREEIELVGVVTDGSEALAVLETRFVDVALLDVDMPGLDGISAATRIAERHPNVKIVMLTAFEQESFLGEALTAGAQGFLTKDIPVDNIVALLKDAAEGKTVMGPRPTEILADSYRTHALRRQEDSEFVEAANGLPWRQAEIFRLLTKAVPNRTIADKLGLTESTVRVYVSQILQATGCQSRSEVAVRALTAGIGAE